MKLLTKRHRERLLRNGAQPGDHVPQVKLFDPTGAGTWLISELDPEDPDIARCLADPGMGHPEIGSVRVSALQAFRGRWGLPIERDRSFHADGRPLSVYAEAARAAGRIVVRGPELDAAAERHRSAAARAA